MLFFQPGIATGVFVLSPEESKHCVRVLRKKPGDLIQLTDGAGIFYEARITNASPEACAFSLLSATPAKKRPFSIHVAIAPTKNPDRIEWFVEKAVELGVETITLLDCERNERSSVKLQRLEKVAIGAMKQSLKAWLPTLNGLTRLSAVVEGAAEDQRFIAFVDRSNPVHLRDAATPGGSYLLLIGPEGDFSDEELTLALAGGFRKVSLGPSRLRTETAGMAGCHVLNLVNGH